jgi:arylsulfatase A-like enzyme
LLLSVLLAGCSQDVEGPSTVRLVDLFGREGVELVNSPSVSTSQRTVWRFGEASAAARPASPTLGWASRGDVSGLAVTDGRLAGETTSDFPILHVEWPDGARDPDRLHSIEIQMKASSGANLYALVRGAENPNLDNVRTVPWNLRTPIIPGDEVQTYRIPIDANIQSTGVRHVLIRPTDVERARFEIQSVRLVFEREHLAETPSGVGWQGLAEIYHESLMAKAPETIRLPLRLPGRPWLDLSIGTIEEGAVTFRVDVQRSADKEPATVVLERTITTPKRWQLVPIELGAFANEEVVLSLALAAGRPGTNGFWGSPVVRNHGQAPPGGPPRGIAAAPQGVILIMADTLRSDHLDAYGYARATAPVVKRLAAEGTLFRDAISQATWTKVAAPSILTSLYPATHMVKDVPHRLSSAAVTLAEVFRDAGYATLSFSSVAFSGRSTNLHQGFDELHENGSRTAENREKSAREYVDRALDWLEAHRDGPFFVFLHIFDPHSPFEPRAPYNTLWADPAKRAAYDESVKKLTPFIVSQTMRPRVMPTAQELDKAGVSPDAIMGYHKDWYDGSIRGMDTEIDRLLERLGELELDDRTLVAFVADHGEEFLEHGRTWHGQSVYGELTNVPLVLWQPGGVPAGAVVAETVRTIDLMPTIIELSGLTVPEGVQGQSLVPLFARSAAARESRGSGDGGDGNGDDDATGWVARPVVSEEHDLQPREGDGHESYALVLGGWRLIRFVKVKDDAAARPEFELYNHRDDPLCLKNVADQHPDIVDRLAKELERWKQRAEAAKLSPDKELEGTLSADELQRLRSLGYIR